MIYFGREYCPAKDHNPLECPICSWVKNNNKLPSFDELKNKLNSYSPKKKYKSLVYYDDRTTELDGQPELSYHSPYSPSKSIQVRKLIDVEVKDEVHKTSLAIDFEKSVTSEKKRKRNLQDNDKKVKSNSESNLVRKISTRGKPNRK